MATTKEEVATPGVGHNDPLGKLMLHVYELGTLKAKGVDTLVQFGLLCVDAAYSGHIDLAKHKHGDTVDDAVKLYAEFEKGRSKASVFDHKSASGKVQAAKLRTCIKLGGWTRGGTGQPLATVNKLMLIRAKLRQDPLQRPKLDDAYATLLRYGRFQLKHDSVQDDDDLLRSLCLKNEKKPTDLEEYLAATCKRLDDLRKGTAASSTLRHTSANVINAIAALRDEIVIVHDQED